MSEFRRNHFVPRFILKNWVTQGHRYEGVYCFDIEEDRSYFASARGKSGLGFAAADDLYIPVVNGDRSTALEKWFSSFEGPLSHVTRQALTRTEELRICEEADAWKLRHPLI